MLLISNKRRKAKIKKLIEVEGMTYEDMINEALGDGVARAICVRNNCDYASTMEPDQDAGWCPECKDNTMQSFPILAGLI